MHKRTIFVIIGAGILSALVLLNLKSGQGEVFLDEFKNDNTKGRFSINAKDYSSRTKAADGAWWEVNSKDNIFMEGPMAGKTAPTAKGGAYGNYMEALGKFTGDVTPLNNDYHGPFLNYRINVKKAGDYILYLYWTGNDGDSDSVYAFILKPDNKVLSCSAPYYLDFFLYHGRTRWTWDSRGLKNTAQCAYAGRNAVAVWNIPKPGIYTIRLALRETGTVVDKIMFQTINLPPPTEY